MSDEAIPRQCMQIAEEIEVLEEELRTIMDEQSEAPPELKAYYVREIRRLRRELGIRKQHLRACELQHDPPALRPDLVAHGISVSTDHQNRRLKVAAIVKNVGKAPATGPFRIDMAVTERSGSEMISHVQVFVVPAGVVIHAQPVLENSNTMAAIVGGNTISNTYVTEKMDLPLRYIDESPSFRYDIEFMVDVEQVLSESDESNNRYFSTRWFSTPAAVQRDKPFIIKSATAALAAGAD